MRRKDREVTDQNEIQKILAQCKVCRIGMASPEGVYIVPMNFGYEWQGDSLNIYLHSAKEGRKISLLRENPQVGIEMDCRHELVESDKACGYFYRYASIIGNGKAQIVKDTSEKQKALSLLMKHQTGKDICFTEFEAGNVAIIKITVTQLSAKKHQ